MKARYKFSMWTICIIGGIVALISWQSFNASKAEISHIEYGMVTGLVEEQPLLSEVVMAEYKNDGRIDRSELSIIQQAYYNIRLRAAKWRLEDAARAAIAIEGGSKDTVGD